MAEHAVSEFVFIQHSAEFKNKISEIFRRHSSIFYKWNRANFTFHITKQAYCFFAHAPDFVNCIVAPGNGIADATGAAILRGKIQQVSQIGRASCREKRKEWA